MRRLLLLIAASSAACHAAGTFACDRDEQCRGGPSVGVCELTGWCSFTDTGCASGSRYDPLAGNGLANICVGEEPVDAGVDTRIDTGSTIDADTTPRTVQFRDGLDGYAGTVDNYISNNVPGPHGTEPVLIWDQDPDEEHSLVRFDAIFGTGAKQIPPGSTIMSATLQIVIVDPTASVGTTREVVSTWDETTTWAGFGAMAGVQAADVGASLGVAPTTGTAMLDVTSSVAAWSANPGANRGWLFSPGGTDGCDVNSRESTNAATRPMLTVTFVAP